MVVEGEFEVAPAEHCFLESQSGVAFMDSDGVLTLLVSTQYPHFHHKQLARVTGLPLDRVRVIQTVVGGAFDGKIDNTIECAAGLLALSTGRPVKMILSREEVFTATTKTHAMKIRQRLGADRDGRLVALDLDILSDGGAYRSYSMTVAGRCLIHAGMPYRIPNLRARFRTIFTNHVPSGAMRSFGVFKQALALESQLDEIAHRLGLGAHRDPAPEWLPRGRCDEHRPAPRRRGPPRRPRRHRADLRAAPARARRPRYGRPAQARARHRLPRLRHRLQRPAQPVERHP